MESITNLDLIGGYNLDQVIESLESDIINEHKHKTSAKKNQTIAYQERFKLDVLGYVSNILGLNSGQLQLDDSLLDFGLDSINGSQMANKFSEIFGLELPPTVLFEFSELDGITNYILEHHNNEIEAYYKSSAFIAEERPLEKETPGTQVTEHVQPPLTAIDKTDISENNNDNSEFIPVEILWQQIEGRLTNELSDTHPLNSLNESESNNKFGLVLNTPDQHNLQSICITGEDHRSKEFLVVGKGKPVLMLGGLLMPSEQCWKYQIEKFSDTYKLIMYQQPGCGRSTPPKGRAQLDSIAKDICDGLDLLNIQEDIAIVGYSFGGLLAQYLCLHYPHRFSSLVVICTTSQSDGINNSRKLMEELRKSPGFLQSMRSWNFDSASCYDSIASQVNFQGSLSDIKCPSLVISASDDNYMLPEYSRNICHAIGTNNYVEVESAGHLVAHTHSGEINDLLSSFLMDESVDRRTDMKQYEPVSSNADTNHSDTDNAQQSIFSDTLQSTLDITQQYIEQGQMGHAIILSPIAAQCAYMLNYLYNYNRENKTTYKNFFMTSLVEAMDAALRLIRHNYFQQGVSTNTITLFYDPCHFWSNYFDPLGAGTGNALVPGLYFFDNPDQINQALYSSNNINALILSAVKISDLAWIEDSLQECKKKKVISVIQEGHNDRRLNKLFINSLSALPDAIVIGEVVAGRQLPVGVCSVIDGLHRPWIRTPNEGYVRNIQTNLGLPLTIMKHSLLTEFCEKLSSSEVDSTLQKIESDQSYTYEIHQKYVNPGYTQVAQMHGFHSRFSQAWGTQCVVELENTAPKKIIDICSNIGSGLRGLNPRDVIKGVLTQHDRATDYWEAFTQRLKKLTGFNHIISTQSNSTAVELGIKLLLIAQPSKNKVVFFNGGSGFTLITAASASDGAIDGFSFPFKPLYPHSIFIDPTDQNAEKNLEKVLKSGEVAGVWFETIQIEANASTPVPQNLIDIISQSKEQGKYYIGVDETQTALVTGQLLNSSTKIGNADIIAISTAFCDGLISTGSLMVSDELMKACQKSNRMLIQNLSTQYINQFTSHLSLHCLQKIYQDDLLSNAVKLGEYFREKLGEVKSEQTCIKEIRGEGLLITIEFDLQAYPQLIKNSFGYLYWGACMRDKILGVKTVVCPIRSNCVRYFTPLNINKSTVDAIVDNIRRVLKKGVNGVIINCADYLQFCNNHRAANHFREMLI